MKNKSNAAWAEAKRRCRLSNEDIALAKRLDMSPKTLMKNIPNANQPWKLPVKEWIRDLAWEKGWIKDKEKDKCDDNDLPF